MSKRRAHRVLVERYKRTPDSNRRRERGLDEVHAEVRGLMEPMRSMETDSKTRGVSQQRYKFTWFGGEDILAGDVVTWLDTSQVFAAEELQRDQYRVGSCVPGYQTIELVERAAPKSP